MEDIMPFKRGGRDLAAGAGSTVYSFLRWFTWKYSVYRNTR